MNKKICTKAYVQLAAGTIGMMLMGIAYAWSLFVTPLEMALKWDRSQTSLVFTLSMIFNAVGMLLSGFLSRKLTHRKLLVMTAALFGSGFWLSSMIHSPLQLDFSYGVLVGLAAGIGYNTITYTVNKWFDGHIGFSSGILFMGFGSGSFLFAGLINFLEKETGWITTFRILAGIMFAALLIITFFISMPENTGYTENAVTDHNVTTKEMLHMPSFYSYYIWAILIWGVGLSIIGNAATMVTSLGGIQLTVIATGVVSITNGVCRVVIGRLYDRLGSRFSLFVVSTAMLAATLLFQVAFRISSIPVLLLALFVGAIGCGGLAPTNSAFMRDCFGQEHYAANFGMFGTFGIFASVLGSFIVGRIFTVSGNYASALIPALVYAGVAMCLQWCVPAQKKERK